MSQRLAARGALIVDADEVVKQLQEPGEPVFLAMVDRWGAPIVAADGTLDRQAVAGIVFGDAAELEALNKLVHPAVRVEMMARAEAAASSDRVVILDIPLLAEGGADRWGASAVIVVDCPPEIAVARLVELRGFDRTDAEARIAAQASQQDRLTMADFVIDNSADLEHLDAEVDRCRHWLDSLDQTPWASPRTAR